MSGLNPILTCEEVVDLLADDLDRSLPTTLYLKFQLHLSLCASCRRFRRTYGRTVRMVRAVKVAENRVELATLPDELVRRIVLRRQTAHATGGESRRIDGEAM
jgi:predicted anti-sigma-YlaC factor YlaD